MSNRFGSPSAVVERLRAASSVLVTTHAAPDGDAIGSELGIAGLLSALGKQVTVANRDPHPAALSFLPGTEKLTRVSDLPDDLARAFDLVVVVDCPGLDRPKVNGLDRLPVVEIDHHLENGLFGEACLVDEEASAIGELVLEVIDAADVAITPEIATALYIALVTDTGDFRYSNTTPRDASRRRAAGGGRRSTRRRSPRRSGEHVPARVVRLTAAVLATLELLAGGRLAVDATATGPCSTRSRRQPARTPRT